MLKIILPYPPSVNTYWGFRGSHRYLTDKAKLFKQEVLTAFKDSKSIGLGSKRLSVTISLFPPDKRVRDIDNVIKSLLDALCQAGAFVDDSQIDRLYVFRDSITKGGKCEVIIEDIL